ncbi:NAD(P)/FAD-dependent oxidoreductase [Streptomyces sp. NBC_01795]|uniref:phytoene desaturase family protein n=1 Tax=Streptomyces sp. NBC_01795 TaxID=2975943 RepID=UPI002DDC2563|nr:NAD(P)/FAD-dependent oxidoreductase [Streptomyces sp. NBC_01795]WSA95312.1 NAD(P)/FAD-dependent oxidoreductase [Streptomyces sp. NBC_01795]
MARIAVIGAGMGAMAAAARLAVAGHEVVVHERTDTYGGALRRYEREGFAFDTGPGLLHLPAVHRDLFVKTGRERLEDSVELTEVPVTAHHIFPEGGFPGPDFPSGSVTLPNASRGKVVDALDEALGAGAGERWAGVLTRGREAWEAVRRPLLEEPLREEPASRAALSRDGAYPALRRKGLLRRRPPTLAEVAADELRDPRLAAVLGSYAWAHGLDPARTPAEAAVLAYIEDTFGTWYVRGGMRALADALHERCRRRRVTFRFGSGVARVREKYGRAVGLELDDGESVEADAVVAGGGPVARQGAAEGSTPGMARLTVLLALRGARPEGTPHRTVVHSAHGAARPLTVLRPDDPTLRPEGAYESAVLSFPVPVGSVRSEEEARRLAEELLASADEAGLGLSGRLLWHEVRTPADNEAETGAPGGLVPPPSLPGAGGAFLRPANRTALEGLYAVGGWSHPGGGLPAAGMTGAMAAGLFQDPDWRGSS